MAFVLNVPWTLWLSPIVQHVTQLAAPPIRRGGPAQVGLGDAGGGGDDVGRVIGEQRRHVVPPTVCAAMNVVVDPAGRRRAGGAGR